MKFLLLIVTIINLIIFSFDIISAFDTLSLSRKNKKIINVFFKIISIIVLYAFAFAFIIISKSLLSFIFDNKIMNEIGFSMQNILDEKIPFLIENTYIYWFAVIDIGLFFLLCLSGHKDKWEMFVYFVADLFIVGFLTAVVVFHYIPNNEGQFAVSLFLLQSFYLVIGWIFAIQNGKNVVRDQQIVNN